MHQIAFGYQDTLIGAMVTRSMRVCMHSTLPPGVGVIEQLTSLPQGATTGPRGACQVQKKATYLDKAPVAVAGVARRDALANDA